MEHADQEAVLLLRVVLALVGAVADAQLVEGGPIAGHFGVQGLFDGRPSLDLGLAPLNLGEDSVAVLQLRATLPEHGAVLHHLLRGLALHFFGDVLDVVPAVLLVGLDELVEVPLGPVEEALRQQNVSLGKLLLGHGLGLVNLHLLLLLDAAGVGSELGVLWHFVGDSLAVEVDFLVQQLEQPGGEELEVLHYRLFRGPGSLGADGKLLQETFFL